MISVYADKYLYQLQSILPEKIDLHLYDPNSGLPEDLSQADALLMRTINRIDPVTLPEIPERLGFIASGSAGTDHVDTGYLADNGVGFAHAPGCNARAVAEYVVTALLVWADRHRIDLQNERIGIIGVGNVGSRLAELLDTLSIPYAGYDPPREERDSDFSSVDSEELLDCPILTFHTPLKKEGPHSTYHWFDRDKVQQQNYKMIVNTSRGGVIDEQALLQAHDEGTIGEMIIDVWENEPIFNDLVAQRALFRTPHIAGYSVQAKTRATVMIVEALISHFGLEVPAETTKTDPVRFREVNLRGSLENCLLTLHPLSKYDQALQKIIGMEPAKKGEASRKLRTDMTLRNEYGAIRVSAKAMETFPVLKSLGVQSTDD